MIKYFQKQIESRTDDNMMLFYMINHSQNTTDVNIEIKKFAFSIGQNINLEGLEYSYTDTKIQIPTFKVKCI